MMQKRTSNLL